MAPSNDDQKAPARFGWKSKTWTQLLANHDHEVPKTADQKKKKKEQGSNNNDKDKDKNETQTPGDLHPDTPLSVAVATTMRQNVLTLVRNVVTDEEAGVIIKATSDLHEETVRYEMARLEQAVELLAFERGSRCGTSSAFGTMVQEQAKLWQQLTHGVVKRQTQIEARLGAYAAEESALIARTHKLEDKLLAIMFFGLCRQEAGRNAVVAHGPLKGATAANMEESCLLEAWNWQVETLRWYVSWLGMQTAELRMTH